MPSRKTGILAVVLVAACGSNGVEIDTSAGTVCSEVAEVACHNLYQCCSEGEIEDFLGIDEPRTEVQCRDDVRKLCERSIVERDFSIAEGRSTFDATTMNGCLNAIIAPDGVCASIAEVLPWTDACMNDAWIGLVEINGDCFAEFECASETAFCGPNQRCTALPTAGQPCNGSCAPGLFCGGGTCQTQVGEGEQCGSDAQCQVPLFCSPSSGPSTCRARGEGGDPCTGNFSCASGQCIPGTCAGVNPFTCFQDSNCNGRCEDDQSPCTQASNCQIGTCSTTTTTNCSTNLNCPGVETCILPVQCLPPDCLGEPVCTAKQITVDYCVGALDELPFP